MGADELTVRRAGARDWEQVRSIRLHALEHAPCAFGARVDHERLLDERAWTERLKASAWFLAETAGPPVGLVACAAGFSEQEREMSSLWVSTRCRRRGVARRLILAVIRWAATDGAGRLALWVAVDNRDARAVYERLGFSQTGRRQLMPNSRHRHEQRMVLDLPGPGRW